MIVIEKNSIYLDQQQQQQLLDQDLVSRYIVVLYTLTVVDKKTDLMAAQLNT